MYTVVDLAKGRDDMKACFNCEAEKPLTDFYAHPGSKGGHVNKCKECTKAGVRANRASKVDKYRAYDRERGNRQSAEYLSSYRKRYPQKYKATGMVNNAIRGGRLFREPCSVCGSEDRVHAHHNDYAKPLNVRWLCAAHHRQWHIENGEGANG